jgi:type II secretory pathway component GspD/PulD (secretin)
LRVLNSAFPRLTFTPGAETGQVLALASPRQHEEIRKLVDQLNQPAPEELAAKAVVYSLKFVTAATAQQTLRTALPQVELTVDRDEPQRFTAWARPADHEKIARILQEIDIEADPESRPTPVVYTLDAIDPRLAVYTIRYLASAFPQAVISTGATEGQLIVFATPRDHEQMKKLVEQINQGPPPELAPTAKVYPLKLASPTAALQTLSRAVPEATLSIAPDSNQIVAWARPTDHDKIAQLLETLDQKAPAELEPKAVVYTIEAADAAEVSRILRYAVPQARITAGADPQQLIVWARPADHELIEDIIQKMGEMGPEELASRVVVYTIPSGDASTALTFLQSTVPAARFSIGSDPRRLIAWARPADHERIKRAVEEISEGAGEVSTRVYRFRYADPTAALSVLGTLVPTAKMAVDRNEQTLVVSAVPEDHDRIRAAVEAMDSEDGEGQRPSLKVHRVEVGDVASVYRSLYTLFRNDASVQLSMDTRNDSLIAIATEAKHERIQEIIQAVAQAAQEDADIAMELYPTKNIDSTAAMEILQQMLDRQGARAELSYDYRTNQLIAIAKPEYQQLIRETLDQLRGEEPLLEIYELQFVDPMSAQLAISRQFSDEGFYGPEVDTDPVTDQLFVRATEEQHQTIRDCW